jgi:hypothetical protein|tara:strand:- start:1413 stop:1616 length:204 start_codon:yes stop_codon:yes gene_type:complete
MIKTKTYGTDLIGITLWSAGSWMKCIEFNTFLINIHFTIDITGQIMLTIGLLNIIYFSFAIGTNDGA